MNSFELIEKYLPSAVDKYFAEDAKTAILENGNKFIDVNFKETGYVKIASFLMDGLSDYYKVQEDSFNGAYTHYQGSNARDGFDIGGTTVTWEIFKLQYCRGKQFQIDYISNEETAGVVIGNAVEEFNRLKVIPEVDATRFGIMADTCSGSLGNLVTETVGADITDTNAATGVIHRFNAAFEWLTDHEVPEDQQVIFVSPAVMTLIRNTAELYKKLSQDEYKNGAGVTFTIDKYEGRPIIVVPSSRFFTDVVAGRGGYWAGSASKAINYMVVSTRAVLPIRKLEWTKVFGPDEVQDFHGYKIDYQIYHGVVIPKNKVAGIYTSVSTAGTALAKANVLNLDVRQGDVYSTWKVNNYFSNPAGMRGTIAYAKTAFTVGSVVTIDGETIKEAAVGTSIVEESAPTYYFALVDANGRVLAASGAIVCPLKA